MSRNNLVVRNLESECSENSQLKHQTHSEVSPRSVRSRKLGRGHWRHIVRGFFIGKCGWLSVTHQALGLQASVLEHLLSSSVSSPQLLHAELPLLLVSLVGKTLIRLLLGSQTQGCA